jgi:hypothetical protein
MSDAALIIATLKKIRRRQFLQLLLYTGSIALLGFLFWLVLSTFRIYPLPRPSAIMQILSGAVLLSAVLVISLLKKPSWKNAAKLVDRTLGLQQRMETSWECIPPRDEVDALILKDTSMRIASIIPGAVVPMHFGRRSRLLFLICLLATTALGIVRILEGWKGTPWDTAGNSPRTIAGSLAQSKNAQKAVSAKSPTNSPEKENLSVFIGSNSESGRRSPQGDSTRELHNIPDQVRLQPAQGMPRTPAPDRGAAGRPEGFPKTSVSSEHGLRRESEKGAGNLPSGRIESASENESHSREGIASADAALRSDAGAASIRKAERTGGKQTGASVLSAATSDAGLLSGGQTGQLSNNNSLTRNKDPLSYRYARENPALWLAVEQALQKEKIPPGFKKYIADYFRAIHP